MKCFVCGREFRPSGRGKPAKYCSGACRAKAYRARKNDGEPLPKPAKPSTKRKPRTVTKTERESPADLDRHSFDRMMDGSHEDTLREIVGRLREALHDPSTPASTLPSISSKLAEFDERMRVAEKSGSLFDADDDMTEVTEDDGASIV